MDGMNEYEQGPYSKRRRRRSGRKQNCCRRFWWAICLAIIAIVLIFVIPVIYVGIPHRAQEDIDASTLEVTHQDTVAPTSDSIHLKLVNIIKSDSLFHPTIDSFPADLSLKDQKPFLTVQVPKIKSSKITNTTIEQDLRISDMDAFTKYVEVVLGSDTFQVYMNGKTTVHLRGLPSMKVDYHKVVTMKGLNKLSNLNITDLKIVLSADPSAPNLLANVQFYNPSVMTLDLGNVTMNLSVDGQSIGTSLMPNVLLQPGPNTLPLQSNTNQSAVLALIAGSNAKYKDGVLPVVIVGDSCVRNGQHLAYYETALKSNPIKLDLNVAPALASMSMNLTQLI